MADKILAGYGHLYEYRVDVNVAMRVHRCDHQEHQITGEDDDCVKCRNPNYYAIKQLPKAGMVLLYEEKHYEWAQIIKQQIRKHFELTKFSFVFYIATRQKERKPLKFGHFIMAITKCEVQRLREQALLDLAG